MDQYRCRGCRFQERCISQSNASPSVKEMYRSAFAAWTDTTAMWAVLQKNCLLVQVDKEQERKAKEGSLLGRRSRQARDGAKEQPIAEAVVENLQPTPQVRQSAVAAPPAPAPSAALASDLEASDPLSSSNSARVATPTGVILRGSNGGASEGHSVKTARRIRRLKPRPVRPRLLTIDASQRRIALPATGKMVLGRFDPHLIDPLDVDLTYEDRITLTVSRRHAQIVGVDGHHTIEDLGSTNGLFVNGVQVASPHAHQLQPGDQIMLGKLRLNYDPIPTNFLNPPAITGAQVNHCFFVVHTGRKIMITPPAPISIGRADPDTNFVPGIDLGQEGVVATYVSRHHALITWGDRGPALQDLESTYGTRLNGAGLHPQQPVALKPGDHMSLGGCVLAYDIVKDGLI